MIICPKFPPPIPTLKIYSTPARVYLAIFE